METSTKKSVLGKGLDALLSSSTQLQAAEASEKLTELALAEITPGRYQPRSPIKENELSELAISIKAQGVIQPLIVRPLPTGQYELIAGERRWRAAKLAGLTHVPVVTRTVNDEDAMIMALVENIQRENLNPIEEALALQRLMDTFEMTHQQLADGLGKSRSSITNLLRLLSLDEIVKEMLTEGKLDMGHARALLSLDKIKQRQAAMLAIKNAWTVRDIEKWARTQQKSKTKTTDTTSPDPNINRLQNQISDQLGARVAIQHAHTGKGKITIHYNSLDELEGILAHIDA